MTDPTTAPRRVGVLSLHNSKETKAILNAVESLGHEPVWLRAENLTASIEAGRVDYRPDVDVVANRLLLTKSDRPLDELGLACAYGDARPVLNRPVSVLRAMHKFGAATSLAAADVPVPDAYLGLDHGTIDDGLERLGSPAVHKALVGTNGSYMSLVEDGPASPRVARRLTFLQSFVEGTDDRAHDVRVYVVDGEVVGAMRRYAPDGDWRTNVALGGEVEGVTDELPERAADLARRAAATFDLDYAGVDLLTDDEGWYVLEVNATAGFKGLFEATGRSPAPHIAALAIERAGGSVSEQAVASLDGDLDDSIPDCKPALTADSPDGETIGFTERVELGGRGGVESVVAKADTGATRTSIDADLAAELDVGPITDTVTVKSGTGSSQRRPVVELDVGLDGRWRTVEASVVDRSHLSHPVLLGRDVLAGYRIAVDRRVDEE